MPLARKPGSRVCRFQKLRAKSSAPTRSTRENAICETTRVCWNENFWRPAVIPRPPDLNTAFGWVCEERNAGARPKIKHVEIVKNAVKHNTRQSMLVVR